MELWIEHNGMITAGSWDFRILREMLCLRELYISDWYDMLR